VIFIKDKCSLCACLVYYVIVYLCLTWVNSCMSLHIIFVVNLFNDACTCKYDAYSLYLCLCMDITNMVSFFYYVNPMILVMSRQEEDIVAECAGW
jgi:hypothetical protein